MSLVCTPQTGKVLNYKNSGNDQLVHKSSTDTRPVRQQNCPKKRKLLKKKKNAKYVTRETGKLAPGLTPSKHDLTPTAMTVRQTGSGKRDHDGGSSDGVERVTSRVRHGRHDQRQATQRRNSSDYETVCGFPLIPGSGR